MEFNKLSNIYNEIRDHDKNKTKLFREILSNRSFDSDTFNELMTTFNIMNTQDINQLSPDSSYSCHKYLLNRFKDIIDIRFLIKAANGNSAAENELDDILKRYNMQDIKDKYKNIYD